MFTNCTPLEISTKYSKFLHLQPREKKKPEKYRDIFLKFFKNNVHKLHSARNFDEMFENSAFSAREQNISRRITGYIFEKIFLEKSSQIALR